LDTVSTTQVKPIETRQRPRFWLLQDGALSRRLFAIAAAWIIPLITLGGFALDKVLSESMTGAFDRTLNRSLIAMIGTAEIGSDGEVRFTRALGDQRYFEPYSGFYWQVSTRQGAPFRSRSLWDRAIATNWNDRLFQDGQQRTAVLFDGERARIAERDVVLPGSDTVYRFIVAARVEELDAQIAGYRRILLWSLGGLGLGLLILAAFQATYGLSPLRRIREELRRVRAGETPRLADDYPPEIEPLITEMNALLAHNEEQAETARTHAGNLAHALKTPMAVMMNDARQDSSPYARQAMQQLALMKRHVDHHLARARALGRRSYIGVRARAFGQAWRPLSARLSVSMQKSKPRSICWEIVTFCFAGNAKN
jgi:Two-component sensor kinase N-terminal